ncbi:streptophobe family protein [Streptomyces sp. NBC_00249]|uniref:streptophobe family protein n=1 Tax=Streptomyces sp. NBC_00249 TaxID=2975690 RepID=UPI0022595174|nr:streptophobe family protein [Streptomyces sp. NBC_00249]MCX5196489.1 streptophobe family protein [Streptomyces sp. NBC_00249]
MRRIRPGNVLLSGIAAVGWSVAAMAGVAALGLRLLGADAAGGSLGAMTAAVVVLASGGSVTPSGDLTVLGVAGAEAETSLDVRPLGVALVGALVLARMFLRSLPAGARGGELAARAAVVGALFTGTAGALAWAGHDVVTLDGARLPLPLPRTPARVEVPGIGDIGGLLPDRVGELLPVRARIGFSAELGPTLVGAAVWVTVVLALALLVSRRGPAAWARPDGLGPAVSAVVAALLVAVAAGLAAAGWAAAGDARPGRVAGAALLGGPNGSWLGVLLGLGVPFEGRATGRFGPLVPDPLDALLGAAEREPVTVARLAEYEGRLWLLAAGAGALLLYAGVLAAVRAPGRGILHCAGWLAAVTGVALAGLVRLTDLSAGASLAVLGVDTVDTRVELHGNPWTALLLGAAWGAAAGAAGWTLTRTLGPRHRANPPEPARQGRTRPGPDRPGRDLPGAGSGPPGHGAEPDGSWDVTVTGIPPRPRRPAGGGPAHRPPFTPPPPPGTPPPPKPQAPPPPPREPS